MKKTGRTILLLMMGAVLLPAKERFQVEIYGGLSYLALSDFNLLAKSEERTNDILFVQRLLGWNGYFTNDLPEIRSAIPAGLRIKYRLSESLAVSVDLEGFRRTRDVTISGTFNVGDTYSLTQTKTYDPFRLEVRGWAVMGGLHYRRAVGRSTSVEAGAAAGWARSSFDFRSSWAVAIDLISGSFVHNSIDGGLIEESGTGNGFAAKAMLRLNRAMGRRFGLFVEAAGIYCPLKSVRGSGRETRLGIPGETTWEGEWGIKKEEIRTTWDSATVFVPTNYWGGWAGARRDRDFVLDLSGARLSLGLYLSF